MKTPWKPSSSQPGCRSDLEQAKPSYFFHVKHVMMQSSFILDKANAASQFIFAVDHQTVYTRKDFNVVPPLGDASLRPQVGVPKDLCTALTDVSNGALFNSRYLLEGRPQQQKKFQDAMGAIIAAKTGDSFVCQYCECQLEDDGRTATSVCSRCDRPNPFL